MFLLSLFIRLSLCGVQSVHQNSKAKRERQRMKDEYGW